MVRKFPSEYFSALLTGQALCGVISAVAQIITITLTEHPVQGGYIFFSIGKSPSISLINLEPKKHTFTRYLLGVDHYRDLLVFKT